MNNYPQWVFNLSDADLRREFGVVTYVRGEQYANRGRVQRIAVAGESVTATVRGSNAAVYRTTVSHPGRLESECSCPVEWRCKHALALLRHLQRQAEGAAVPAWQRALAQLVQEESLDTGVPLALELFEGDQGLHLRPLQPGRREPWVRTGATWNDIRLGSQRFVTSHRAALTRIQATADGYGDCAFNRMRPDCWEALRRAAAAGVQLIPGPDTAGRQLPQPRLHRAPVEPWVLLESIGEAVRLRPFATVDGRDVELTVKSLLGHPAHGLALAGDEELLLVPLSRPLDFAEHALLSAGALVVETPDLPMFAAGYLPALRERLRVQLADGVVLPEPPELRLVCRAAFTPGAVEISWGVRYLLGGSIIDVGLTPTAGEPRVRRPADERRLQAEVPAGPWRATTGDLRDARLSDRALIEFVSSVLPKLQAWPACDVEITGEVANYQRAEAPPDIVVTVTEPEQGDWFNLEVEVRVAGEVVPFADLFRALSLGEDHLVLDSGVWFSLEAPELARLRQLVAEARTLVDTDGDGLRLRPEHAGLWEEFADVAVVRAQAERWRQSVEALLHADTLLDDAPPPGLHADLRPYQLTGYRWLRLLWRSSLGGILADEMGLGKTLQSLAMVQAALVDGELSDPALVVAPTSVLGTWAAEAKRFVPDLKVVTITETQTRRGTPLAELVAGAHLVLTSYTLLRLEADDYQALRWSAVLLDEAQFVKNRAAKIHQAVRRLRSRCTIALTGTPLENNLMDLWSLLALTAPGLFRDPKVFTEQYRRPIERGDTPTLDRLRRRLRPLMLRRTKAAVAAELPPKQVQLVPVELSEAHRTIYERHLARERQKVLGLVGDLDRNRITILRALTRLRQLSLAPCLIDDSYPAHSAKIDTLVDLLEDVIGEGHRALVFSQFTGFLGLVRERLRAEGIEMAYLDGSTRDREAVVAGFREGTAPVFLISLKAGGFGLNLVEADYVFVLDPWWNPAAENQAIDRAHRIGQERPVNVYRLVAAETIEEKVVALQDAKRHLFDHVVGAATDLAAPLSADDIRALVAED